MLSPEAQRDEYVLMGLRIIGGISLARLRGIYPDPKFETVMAALIQDGYLGLSGDRLFATPKGRLVLNHITEKLLAGS
jgi:oxygen-independent coproporphyrinogen-3 oxidase